MSNQLQLVVAYNDHQRKRGLAATTIRSSLRVLLSFADSTRLDSATRADIEAFALRPQLGMRTQRFYVSRLSAFYRWCHEEGLIPTNPARGVIRPKVQRCLPRPISEGDLRMAIGIAPPRLRAWLSLAAYQGLRCMEIAGLDGQDIAGELLIVRAGKGGKPRVMPLNPQVQMALADYGVSSGALFVSLRHGRVSASTVSSNINRYLHGIGIDATAHQLRHWFGTETYRRCHDIRMVQELMGHSSPESTAIYTAFSNEEAALLVRSLDVMAVA